MKCVAHILWKEKEISVLLLRDCFGQVYLKKRNFVKEEIFQRAQFIKVITVILSRLIENNTSMKYKNGSFGTSGVIGDRIYLFPSVKIGTTIEVSFIEYKANFFALT